MNSASLRDAVPVLHLLMNWKYIGSLALSSVLLTRFPSLAGCSELGLHCLLCFRPASGSIANDCTLSIATFGRALLFYIAVKPE